MCRIPHHRVIRWVFVGLAVFGLWTPMNIVRAAVNVCDESSLRAAVAAGGHVTFNCDGTILLSSTLVITQDVVLDATGRSVAISGDNRVRIIEVKNGADLELIHLTLERGLAEGTNGAVGQPGGRAAGGAVLVTSPSALNATDCNFFNNRAVGGRGGDGDTVLVTQPGSGGPAEGGAIAHGVNVFLTNCLFLFNAATGGAGGFWSLGGHPVIAPRGFSSGGAVSTGDNGWLVAGNCMFTSNAATAGGAIDLPYGRGNLSNCWFSANKAENSGGAIQHGGASLVVSDSVFFSNSTSGRPAWGGGIRHGGVGNLSVERCKFGGNIAAGSAGVVIGSSVMDGGNAAGGALAIFGGQATVSACVFDGNWAVGGDGCCPGPPRPASAGSGRGGGIYSQGLTTVRNTTFANNVARAGGGPIQPLDPAALGGGLACGAGELRIQYSTIASNAAYNFTNSAHGGGVAQLAVGASAMVYLENSLVSGNTTNNAFGENVYPRMLNGEYNVSSDATPGSTNTANNLDPNIGPLGDNGGPVATMALLAGSPAVNSADPAACVSADARGVNRPQNGRCDVGAFEQTFLELHPQPNLHVLVSYSGVPNETYTLESSWDLINWQELLTQSSGDGLMSWELPGTAFKVVFRIKLLP
jgi:hypothetical protein